MPFRCERCQGDTKSVIQQKDGGLFCRTCHNEAKYDGLKMHETPYVFRDEIPGGVTVENYGPQPMTFYSHSERRAYMRANGLHERETFAPMPGTDKDPQGIPNPKGYMDPQTLENARILISRNGARVTPDDPMDGVRGVLGSTFSGDMTARDAQALANGDRSRQSRLHRRTDGSH
jgi:hypothetical protein